MLLEAAITTFYLSKFPDVERVTMLKYGFAKLKNDFAN